MIKFFTNRELAECLGVNLAKWKRWSREFLPPDPLGGLQSGYARQYNPNEAFTVHLGGHLVANNKFSIPEARQILDDLNEWLSGNGYYFDANAPAGSLTAPEPLLEKTLIFILRRENTQGEIPRFSYIVRGFISQTAVNWEDSQVMQALYTETFINAVDDARPDAAASSINLLNINEFLIRFVKCMGLDETCYAALSRPVQPGLQRS